MVWWASSPCLTPFFFLTPGGESTISLFPLSVQAGAVWRLPPLRGKVGMRVGVGEPGGCVLRRGKAGAGHRLGGGNRIQAAGGHPPGESVGYNCRVISCRVLRRELP